MMPAAEETRTLNLRITSALRCQLRHGGMCLYSYNRRLRTAQTWYRAKNRKEQRPSTSWVLILPCGPGRRDKIRTCDPLNPNQIRYQTAPLSEEKRLCKSR